MTTTDLDQRHPAVRRQLDKFAYDHLPPHLAEVSKVFHDAAHQTAGLIDDGPDLTEALRHLWSGKNEAVYAAVEQAKASAAA